MDFEGIYCFDTTMVRFAVYPDGPDGTRVLAQISQNVLHDAFGAVEIGEQALLACRRHFDVIGAAAIARYRIAPHRSIVLACDELCCAPQVHPLEKEECAAIDGGGAVSTVEP